VVPFESLGVVYYSPNYGCILPRYSPRYAYASRGKNVTRYCSTLKACGNVSVVYKKKRQGGVETDRREFSVSAATSSKCKKSQKVCGSIPEVSFVKHLDVTILLSCLIKNKVK